MVSGERFELGKDWKISEGQVTNKVNKVVVVVVVVVATLALSGNGLIFLKYI